MQAYEGYVENGLFYPIGALMRVPTRLRAFLTILDEPIKKTWGENDMSFWVKFDQLAAASASEELQEEDFPRMKFGREPVTFSDTE